MITKAAKQLAESMGLTIDTQGTPNGEVEMLALRPDGGLAIVGPVDRFGALLRTYADGYAEGTKTATDRAVAAIAQAKEGGA
ncbi:MAG TPA: hypothetical protein VM487_06540 [Phycisphaerae bacterium]|nr:hypothetical protein [Phycisphaerae bacterium]